MIEPQIKRGTTRDGRGSRVVWRLYYFTRETWTMPATWTCGTRAEARWFAFTHQWTRVGGAASGIPERAVGRLIVEGEVLVLDGDTGSANTLLTSSLPTC